MVDDNLTDREAAIYLAAFIDGEGHVGLHPTKKGFYTRSISFCNTDKQLFDFVVFLCRKLGFKPAISHDKMKNEKWADRWTCYIARSRPSISKFQEIVPIKCTRKQETLRKIMESWKDIELSRAKRMNGSLLPCAVCAAPVYASKAFRTRGHGRFCSVKCRGEAQQKRITLKCESCHKDFTVIKTRRDTARFCSRSCFGRSNGERIASFAKKAANKRWHRSSV